MWARFPLGTGLTIAITAVALQLTSSRTTALAAEEFKGQRWAVVIGVTKYQDERLNEGRLKLQYAARDAREFADFLKTQNGGGYVPFDRNTMKGNLLELYDEQVTFSSVREALKEFLPQAEKEDYVLVYLAGHGLNDPKSTNHYYFLPHDAMVDRLGAMAVGMEEIALWLDRVLSERKVLIADACHSGAISLAGTPRGPRGNSVHSFLQELNESYPGVVTITSSREDQLSHEDERWGGGHGVFTYYLLRAVKEDASKVDGYLGTKPQDGKVDIEEAFEWVRDEVKRDTAGAQIPDKSGDIGIGIPLVVGVSRVETKRGPGERSAEGNPSSEMAKLRAELEEAKQYAQEKATETARLQVELDKLKGQIEPSTTTPTTPATSMTPATTNTPKATVEARARPYQLKEEIDGKDGAPMRLVPAGEFLYGPDNQHRSLPAFYMDKYEVTTKLYAQLMDATKRKQPEYWSEVHLISDADRPVIGVTWEDADAYCRQYGKRLPTEQEWEKAARGTDGRKYPWGNEEPTIRHANYGKCCDWKGYAPLATVESYEAGKSPYGIYNMAGNVWEWTSSNYVLLTKVVRGSSWVLTAVDLRSAYRSDRNPSKKGDDTGFRCAQDAS